MWKAIVVLLVLCLAACEPLETGEPPTFSGVNSATAMGESQIQLRWNAASDDLLQSTELRYGIWYAASGEAIDASTAPNKLTGNGALSYTVTGLKAETTYAFLVRASDSNTVYSDNTQQLSATTTAANSGLFAAAKSVDVDRIAEGMVGGPAFSGGGDDIGLIDGNEIIWYESGTSGALSLKSDKTSPGADIQQAILAPMSSNSSADLLVRVANAFYYYPNRNGNLSFERSAPFGVTAKEDSISLTYREGIFRYLCFVDSSSKGEVWSVNATPAWTKRKTIDLSTDAAFTIGFFSADDKPDLLEFSSAGLRLSLGKDTELNFDSPSSIDSLAHDLALHKMQVVDYDLDGFLDILVFERSKINRITRLHFFHGNGDGTFASKNTIDYESAIYANPRFVDMGGADSKPELVFTQTASNNLIIYTAGVFNTVLASVGNEGLLDYSYVGNLDNSSGNDVVLFSSAAKKLSVLQRVTSSTK